MIGTGNAMIRRAVTPTKSICVVLLSALSAAAYAERAAAEPAPYQARVIAANTPVHSGPGEKFYHTDMLAQGDVVEVYREKPGGWLGIRPPLNSFSWVAERDLVVKDGGLGEVVRDDVASRIGSRVGDRRNAAQVRLKKGEQVEVLGEETVKGEKWYRIAPPAGEFRWIQASLVERSGPVPTSQNESDASSAAAATPAESSALPPQPIADNATKPVTPVPDNPPPATDAQTPGASPSNDLATELTAIELRLSRMAAAPTNLWNTERLERDTAQLLGRAKTPAERDAVRLTQEKINRFAAIGRRHQQGAAGMEQAINPLAANSPPPGYDAVGILRPVVSRRPGAPQFALVDERGQVVTFVSSTPDLNLQPYLGRRIAIVGNRGYIPEFQRATVTASRVTPLNERIVR
jgi:uncharacterized protein YgiM (DUF1202 family)